MSEGARSPQPGQRGGALRAVCRSARRSVGAVLGLGLVLGLAACASGPQPPEWALAARDATQAAAQAHLSGRSAQAQALWARAAQAAARTADASAMARVALAECAVRLASLQPEVPACAQAQAWLHEAAAMPELAPAAAALAPYAAYVQAQPASPIEALPAAHRPLAQWLAGAPALPRPEADAQAAAILGAVAEPLARLVAASVVWRSGHGGPQVLALAVQTASAQGWVRPLAVWLRLQAQWAEAAGEPERAQQIRQRLQWLPQPLR